MVDVQTRAVFVVVRQPVVIPPNTHRVPSYCASIVPISVATSPYSTAGVRCFDVRTWCRRDGSEACVDNFDRLQLLEGVLGEINLLTHLDGIRRSVWQVGMCGVLTLCVLWLVPVVSEAQDEYQSLVSWRARLCVQSWPAP